MRFKRLNKLISVIITSIIIMCDIPFFVHADIADSPRCLSVQPDLKFEVATTVTSNWENHENIDIIFTNTGEQTIHNWYFTFYTANNIDNIWNATIFEMDGNGLYTIKNNGYNQDILPGNSISIGVTLSSNAEEVTFNPEWYLLNTKEIVIDDALYSLEYSEYSAWDNGFTGVINLQTYIDCQHWQIAFDCNRQILSMSSVEFVDEGESRYSITHDSNNLSLMVGNNNGFGVQGVNSEEELILSNMIFTSVVPAYSVTDDSNSDGIPDCLDFINANIGTISTPTVTTTPIEEVTVVPTRNPETTESEQSTITPPIVVTDVPNTPSQNIDWNVDTDQDGLPDDYEDLIGTEKDNPDSDDDGLTDYFEIMLGYNPTNKDSDNNGIFDGDEDYDNDGLKMYKKLHLEPI